MQTNGHGHRKWSFSLPQGWRGSRSNLLSLGTLGLEVPPAEVLPTGLECLGPRPGIFSPLDFSMFILQKQGAGQELGTSPRVLKACGSGTRCGNGGCLSPWSAIAMSGERQRQQSEKWEKSKATAARGDLRGIGLKKLDPGQEYQFTKHYML